MNREQLNDLHKRVREILKLKSEADATVIKLMEHPDSTTEHIVAARDLVRRVRVNVEDVITKTRTLYPPEKASRFYTYVWNDRNYDRYDKRKMISGKEAKNREQL